MFAFKPKREEYKKPEESFVWLDEEKFSPQFETYQSDNTPVVLTKGECVSSGGDEHNEESLIDRIKDFFEYHWIAEVVTTTLLGTLIATLVAFGIPYIAAMFFSAEVSSLIASICLRVGFMLTIPTSILVMVRIIKRIIEGY